jgi:hypothetical protein
MLILPFCRQQTFHLKPASMFSKIYIKSFMVIFMLITFISCQKKDSFSPSSEPLIKTKNIESSGHLKQTKTFSSHVVGKWLEQQLKMFRLPLAYGAAPSTDRAFAYSGIALYESVVPGMPAYQSLAGQLNQFPVSSNPLPKTVPGLAYHWAASANATLAEINRKLFTGAPAQTAINQLESQLQSDFINDVDEATMQRSINFGRAVANAVWAWAQGDGLAIISTQPVFTVPADAGPGAWQLTSAGAPANAYHKYRRLIVAGSNLGAAAPALPFGYSTQSNSDYFKMAKEVYDTSLSLSPEQRQIALYHREGGVVNGGSYGGGATIAGQLAAVFTTAQAKLDLAAEAYAKVGMGSYDALTQTFKQKYEFLTMRPITFIRANMNATWNTLFGTPLYPEYPAGHPTNGGMLAVMLSSVFGSNFSFDVNYYGESNWPGNGLTARHYNSFEEMAHEMAIARFYAGIHYKPGVFAGVNVGKKVAQNILANVKFLKD